MPTFAEALKKEIARLARKELKSDVSQLRRLVNLHRSEIAGLKREMKALQAQNKALAKSVRSTTPVRASHAEVGSEDGGQVRRGRKPVFSAEGLKAMRLKLGITQSQLASLLEVSSLSIYKWESGQATPRAKQQEKVFALRTVGKRAVLKALASQSEPEA